MHYETEDILHYLSGTMDEAAREAFEAACRDNAELQGRTDACRDSMEYYRQQAMERPDTDVLRTITGEMNSRYFSTDTTTTSKPAERLFLFRSLNIAAMAAGLAILVFLGFRWLYTPDLLDSYGRVHATAVAERGTPADADKVLLAELINKEAYQEALPVAARVLKTDPAAVNAKLYYGLCLLHTGDYAASRRWLQQVYDGESLQRYRAGILLALAYAKEQQPGKGIDILKQIPADAAEYNEARELLKELK